MTKDSQIHCIIALQQTLCDKFLTWRMIKCQAFTELVVTASGRTGFVLLQPFCRDPAI